MLQIMLAGETLYRTILEKLSYLEGLAPLLLRLYLVPILWMAGTNKYQSFDSTVDWFGNPDWGLGLPAPWLMAFLATGAELVGAVFLLLGVATRLTTIPLMVTMIVAAATVHWSNGWQAIADAAAPFANEAVMEAPAKLEKAREILQEHGNYDWLMSSGKIVVLNNGIEFAATYFIMLLALFYLGGGRYVSLDYYISGMLRRCRLSGQQ